MRITRVVFVIAVVGLCSFGPTTPSRGYAQDPPDEEARLRQRVQVLESQLQGLLEKYERSAGFRATEAQMPKRAGKGVTPKSEAPAQRIFFATNVLKGLRRFERSGPKLPE